MKIPDGPLTVQIFASSEENGSVNSYLVMGEKDALLIDAQLVESHSSKHYEDAVSWALETPAGEWRFAAGAELAPPA